MPKRQTSHDTERDLNDPVALKLRFNEALRRQIADAAKRSVRSINSEIVYRLRTSFGDEVAAS
jgi:hypothetical protein